MPCAQRSSLCTANGGWQRTHHYRRRVYYVLLMIEYQVLFHIYHAWAARLHSSASALHAIMAADEHLSAPATGPFHLRHFDANISAIWHPHWLYAAARTRCYHSYLYSSFEASLLRLRPETMFCTAWRLHHTSMGSQVLFARHVAARKLISHWRVYLINVTKNFTFRSG
jgi:hypothetical protein